MPPHRSLKGIGGTPTPPPPLYQAATDRAIYLLPEATIFDPPSHSDEMFVVVNVTYSPFNVNGDIMNRGRTAFPGGGGGGGSYSIATSLLGSAMMGKSTLLPGVYASMS